MVLHPHLRANWHQQENDVDDVPKLPIEFIFWLHIQVRRSAISSFGLVLVLIR